MIQRAPTVFLFLLLSVFAQVGPGFAQDQTTKIDLQKAAVLVGMFQKFVPGSASGKISRWELERPVRFAFYGRTPIVQSDAAHMRAYTWLQIATEGLLDDARQLTGKQFEIVDSSQNPDVFIVYDDVPSAAFFDQMKNFVLEKFRNVDAARSRVQALGERCTAMNSAVGPKAAAQLGMAKSGIWGGAIFVGAELSDIEIGECLRRNLPIVLGILQEVTPEAISDYADLYGASLAKDYGFLEPAKSLLAALYKTPGLESDMSVKEASDIYFQFIAGDALKAIGN